MSTRCLTVFLDENETEIAVMYRHCDGYPAGHGMELKSFLKGKIITNGIGNNDTFNGMPCLIASVIAAFKKGPGGIYLHAAGTRDIGEEYIYIVSGKEGEEAKIKTIDVYK